MTLHGHGPLLAAVEVSLSDVRMTTVPTTLCEPGEMGPPSKVPR